MRQDVEEAVSMHGLRTRRNVKRWKNGLRALEADLAEGEICYGIVDGGPDEYGVGLLMITQARLLSWQPQTGLSDMWMHDIVSVHSDRLPGQEAVIVQNRQIGPVQFRIGSIQVADVLPTPKAYSQFIYDLNQIAREAIPPDLPPPPGQSVAPVSAADEIMKLGGLLEQGLITEDEFEVGKRQALGQ